MPTRSSPRANRLDTPNTPAIRFTRALNFGAYGFAFATACQFARLPLSDQTRIAPSAPEAFTSRLSDRSVTLPAAGYDYDIDWTPMSAGLAPAGIAASFAALARIERSKIRDQQRGGILPAPATKFQCPTPLRRSRISLRSIRAAFAICAAHPPGPIGRAPNSRTGSPSTGRYSDPTGPARACSSDGFPRSSAGHPPAFGTVA